MKFGALSLFVLPMLAAVACSGGQQARPVKHHCTLGTSSCSCTAFDTDGDDDASQSGMCNARVAAGAVCCATENWPNLAANGSSSSCDCVSGFGSTCPDADPGEPGSTVPVDRCDFNTAPTGGGSDAGSTTKCTDPGYCGPDGSHCACGTECVHYGPGEYMCGFDCASTSDCAGKKDPPSGDALTSCNPGLETDVAVYDGYCIR